MLPSIDLYDRGESMINFGIYPNDILIVDRSLTACHKDIMIALIDGGFTAKQLILGENIIMRAHNDNYADIVVKGSLELFVVVASSIGGLSGEVEKET